MPRELRISATVSLPDGVSDEAETPMKLRQPITAFEEAIKGAAGKFDVDVVVPKPRGVTEAVPVGRAAVNGAGAEQRDQDYAG